MIRTRIPDGRLIPFKPIQYNDRTNETQNTNFFSGKDSKIM